MHSLINILKNIEDHREFNGKEYQLWEIILLTVVAIQNHAFTYSNVFRFIKTHFEQFKGLLHLKWRHPPTLSCIWKILTGLDIKALEVAFRQYANEFIQNEDGVNHICFDGKAMRGSASQVNDERAARIFNVFDAIGNFIVAHIPLASEKDHEIQALQKFLTQEIQTGDLLGAVVTADAEHCQKKL
jgi:hypothetical protein